jgi:hypothetical protein
MKILVAFLALLAATTSEAFIINVPANREQCVYTDVEETGDRVIASFEVISGGMLDADVEVRSPKGRLVFSQKRAGADTVKFTAGETGYYKLCFGNTMSSMSSKAISFSFDSAHMMPHREAAKKGQLNPMLGAFSVCQRLSVLFCNAPPSSSMRSLCILFSARKHVINPLFGRLSPLK